MSMQLDSSILRALRCFEAAGRQLSFTKAAQTLHLTQSAVSQQIRHLEDRLGYALFVRQPSGLIMTPNGEILFQTTSNALSDIAHTLQQLDIATAPLQVNCLPSLALQWLVPRLTEFQRMQPTVSVRLKAEFQAVDRQAMNSDGIDVAVRYDPVDYSHMHSEILMDEYLVAVATPAYLENNPRFASGESLDGVTLLHDAAPWADAPEYIEWRTWAEEIRPEWAGRLDGPQFNLSSLALGAARMHQGAAMGRFALVYDDLKSGRLVDVLGRSVQAPARYMLLSRQPEDRRVAAFSDWLRTECKHFDEARTRLLSA